MYDVGCGTACLFQIGFDTLQLAAPNLKLQNLRDFEASRIDQFLKLEISVSKPSVIPHQLAVGTSRIC